MKKELYTNLFKKKQTNNSKHSIKVYTPIVTVIKDIKTKPKSKLAPGILDISSETDSDETDSDDFMIDTNC